MKTLLHAKTNAHLDAVIAHPTGSVIFHGPRGLGKATAARELAAMLNCLGTPPDQCANCRQIEAGNFPDLLTIDRGEKASIAIEQIRRLVSELALRPYGAKGTRVVIIDGAHLLTTEAQNALLKLLEEPPPRTLIVLVAEHLEALLLTVRSRCRFVHFVRPGEAAVAGLLERTASVKPSAAAAIAALSAGAPGTALTLAAHPDEAEGLLALTQDASGTQERSLFQRLLLAGRLAAAGTDVARFGEALHNRTIAGLAAGEIAPATATVWLAALERFRTHLGAKVAPRVALERLMLELG
jgi:DNA polymerase-3 subunit delta'